MPVYDFKCADHGFFHELVSVEQAGKSFPCPQCGCDCTPIVLIAPSILSTPKETKKAIESNEEAQHNPIISTEDSRMEAADKKHFELNNRAKKGSSCGCSEHRSDQSALKKKVVYLPDGSKVFPSQRPWMISH